MKRSELQPLPAYFDRYINKNDDVDLMTALRTGLTELEHAPIHEWSRIGDRVYAPGKWTVKDILQHLIDTERVFAYRALAFSRGDADQPSYDEDTYARLAEAGRRSLEELQAELIIVRHGSIALFGSLTEAMRDRVGNGFKGPYSVRDIGFILPGHQRWHVDVINERYLPLR